MERVLRIARNPQILEVTTRRSRRRRDQDELAARTQPAGMQHLADEVFEVDLQPCLVERHPMHVLAHRTERLLLGRPEMYLGAPQLRVQLDIRVFTAFLRPIEIRNEGDFLIALFLVPLANLLRPRAAGLLRRMGTLQYLDNLGKNLLGRTLLDGKVPPMIG